MTPKQQYEATPQVFDTFEQGDDAWFAARLGIPTSSKFSQVMAEGKGAKEGKKDSVTRHTYMLQLVGERLTQIPKKEFRNHHMDRGHEMEGEARELYAMSRGVTPKQVAFIRLGDAGASPDALIGDDGMLEIKSKEAHLQIDCLLKDKVPSAHRIQLQGELWIAGRQWVDFVSYCPALPLFVKRVFRDEEYIKVLANEVRVFNIEVAQLVTHIDGYGKRLAA